jgi:acyl-coenzyme A thioesterase PaaI-like protein
VPAALFEVERDRLRPTELARGPWSPDALHGGPVAAVLARAVESCDTMVPMRVARLTVELIRPVPLAPLLVSARVVRPGKRVQLVEGSVVAGETEVARATALQIRTAEVPLPEQAPFPQTPSDPMAAPERGPLPSVPTLGTAYHADGVEMRFVRGAFGGLGPATAWMRLRHPVVEGEEPSPLQRVAAVADFGNGISKIVPFDSHIFINPDLTVAVARAPVGEWVGLDAVSRLSQDGVGQAESLLFDQVGVIGRAVQSLYVEAR